jgi:hypothetical protein
MKMHFSEMVCEDVESSRPEEPHHTSGNKLLCLLLCFTAYKHGNIKGGFFFFSTAANVRIACCG